MPNAPQYKVIISDTTCLIALNNSSNLEILKHIYNNITVTPSVKKEYEEKGDLLPEWIIIKEPQDKKKVLEINKNNNLHFGESESIVLAMEDINSLIILDDKDAREYAINIGLKVTGTIGIINEARKKEIININEAINTLSIMKEKNFWISDKLFNDFINYMKSDEEKKITKQLNSMGFIKHETINTKIYNTLQNMKLAPEEKYTSKIAKLSKIYKNCKYFFIAKKINNDTVDLFRFRHDFSEKQAMTFLNNFYHNQQKNKKTKKLPKNTKKSRI